MAHTICICICIPSIYPLMIIAYKPHAHSPLVGNTKGRSSLAWKEPELCRKSWITISYVFQRIMLQIPIQFPEKR